MILRKTRSLYRAKALNFSLTLPHAGNYYFYTDMLSAYNNTFMCVGATDSQSVGARAFV